MPAKQNKQNQGGEFVQPQAAPDPVVDLDEASIDDLLIDELFNEGEPPAPEVIQDSTSFADALKSDRRFHNPSGSGVKPSEAARQPAAIGGDAINPLAALLQDSIKELVSQQLASLGLDPSKVIGGNPIIDPAFVKQAHPAPPSYKKHYRCDSMPDLKIQALDMTALDRGDRPQASPLPGKWVTFRRGHLYTSDDNEIAQIEYMRQRPATNAYGESLGGNPHIYEDDGGDIFRCPQGCDYITASKNAFKAHMKATHQIEL